MPKNQCKNIMNNRKVNMVPPEFSYLMSMRSEQTNAVESQENNLENNIVTMIETVKKEIKKCLKEIEKKTKKRKNQQIPKRMQRKSRTNKQTGERNSSNLKMKIEAIEKAKQRNPGNGKSGKASRNYRCITNRIQ